MKPIPNQNPRARICGRPAPFPLPAVLIAAFITVLATAAPLAQSPFSVPMVVDTLSNGLTTILVPYDTPGVVAYWTVVRAGSRNEIEPGRTGYAHLLEHLMFRGTEKYPAEKYNEAISLMGADANAFTDEDWTVYICTIPAAELPWMIEIQADRFQDLAYDEAGYVKETGAVLGEFNIGKSDPGTRLEEKLLETAFIQHTYGHTVMGYENDVRDMPEGIEYSRHFHDLYYCPNNCAVVITGDFSVEAAKKLIQKQYGDWERCDAPPAPDPEPVQEEPRRSDVKWPGSTNPRLAVAFKIPEFHLDDTDAPALEIIQAIAFGPTSPFYQRWIEERLRAQKIEAEAARLVDPHLFIITMTLIDPADLEEARDDILNTLKDLAANPPSIEELAAVKRRLRYETAMRLETAGSVAYTLAQFYNLTGDPGSIYKYFTLLEQVMPEDIQRVAARYLIENQSTTVTLVSEEG
ncbi:MAG: insulinase family protein [Candidatus Eisenbacteria bacterium]|uniref:Insulinase family protein n=1 Tax=Eiseniibacteriota bacterium TaxID=2212470 RepID=A0A948W7M0_UNCEI|nr:insulinase family protein [Candidatus Eisenbacteria bacterium]MBU1949129.1 insulinase family protein [Candidatus Eisenbacteria bacterium]MBU2692395.1 insulinase family protein [Candidatus Eisenbacteria bacterium]